MYDLEFKDVARFWSKVEVGGNLVCWEWRACKRPDGYGKFNLNGKMVGAHRIAFTLRYGQIQDGMHIDHLCRNPSCVNPEHLEAVTSAENTRRGLTGQLAAARQNLKTHCPKGHEYSFENTYYAKGEKRHCRTCTNERSRDKRAKLKLKLVEVGNA